MKFAWRQSVGQEHYPPDNVVVVVAQKYKPWMMRPQVFMGIHVCSLAKQIQSSFDKSLHCQGILVRMQIPKVLSARHAFVVVVVVCLPRKLFMSYLMIFKCAFVICLCSIIVDICLICVQDRWSCELIATKSGNRLMFFGCIVTKSFNKVNISEKNLQC